MLRLEIALNLARRAIDYGRANRMKPLTAAVLDAGGYPIVVLRDDRSSNFRPQIAIGKAASALGLGVSSGEIKVMADERPVFFSAIAAMTGSLVPAAGGVLIADSDRVVIGAIGVTGDTSENDEAAALAAIEHCGLETIP